MNHPYRFPSITALILALFLAAFTAHAEDDGIYADFVTTMGNFTCKLAYDKAPRAVASFMGLATGERAWVDPRNGDVKKTPFYSGIIFHRVVSGFVIQAGSPNGLGTDGPGYAFQDEFDPTLRHNKAGILAMANSGANTNGSQFYLTLDAQSYLDDSYSVFGEVTSGLPSVMAIGVVPVTNSKPNTPVVINSVTIRRIGTAANAFNITTQGLPVVNGAGPVMTRSGTNFGLQFARSINNEYRVFDSADLATWASSRLGPYLSTPPTADVDVTATTIGQSKHFYRVTKATYPVLSPALLAGRELRSNLGTVVNLITLKFNNAGGGTCDYKYSTNPVSSGTITSYTWVQDVFGGTLTCYTSNLPPLQFAYTFTAATGGAFKGAVYQATTTAVSGSFYLVP